jgi:DNA polymerase-3 subunit beta
MVTTETKQAVSTVTTVDTKDLTKELEWAARFADKRSRIPILQNVSLRSVKGSLQLIATDLETAGITTVPANGAEFAVTVPADQTLKYLRKVSDASVSLSVDNNKLVIQHGDDSEATINGLAIDSYPELPAFPKDRFMLKGLESALPRVICSISADESRFTLNGALLEISATKAHFVSTDGHRMSIVPIKPGSRKAIRRR